MDDYTITTDSKAAGGSPAQSIESIKKLSPRYFATQQRAVASDDYGSLVLSEFSGSISDVAVYGGETVEPKQYGRVLLALKPTSSEIAPTYIKDEITNYLTKYIAIPNRVVIVDPDYLHLEVSTTVQYNKSLTTKKASEIKGLVLNAVTDFSELNLELFQSDFRYSRFVNEIDNADGSIVSNDTSIRIIKKLAPTINSKEYYSIDYNNQLHPGRFTVSAHPVFKSSTFTYRDDNGVDYTDCYLIDDGNGTIILAKDSNSLSEP